MLGRAWRTLLPSTNPRGSPVSPEMHPELPPLPPSAPLLRKRDLRNGWSLRESHPTWEWAALLFPECCQPVWTGWTLPGSLDTFICGPDTLWPR